MTWVLNKNGVRTRYRYDEGLGKAVPVEGDAPEERPTGTHILARSEVNMASSVLPKWDQDHKAMGGKFTKDGKPIFESRHAANEYARRSQGERDVYWEFGDIDRL